MKTLTFACRCALAAAGITYAAAQTQVDLRTQTKNVDFSAAPTTKPSKTGTSLPGACSTGETFLKTNASAGQNLYVCTGTNVWSVQGTPFNPNAANTYSPGAKQTVAASGTTAGLRIAPAALPGAPTTGDLAVDANDGNQLKIYNGASWTSEVGAGGGAYAANFSAQTSVTIAG